MTRFLAPSFAAATLMLAGCSTFSEMTEETIATADLMRADGTQVGTARLLERGDTMSIAVTTTAVPAGVHGFHLHTTGQCTPPDFTSAGGHLNPTDQEHGNLNPAGAHLGDLPNLKVEPSGRASMTADLTGTRGQVLNWLFDADGTAVMIHSGPDDYRTEPAGDAGPRIACGVLTRS